MIIASFYAPRPDHPFFQDYLPFLEILGASCRKFGHRHIVLTDAPSLGELETFHVELPDSLMKAVTAAQLAYLKSPLAKEDTILVGADCVLAKNPAPAFSVPFDLAVTTHPFTDCILNTGAIFVRGGSDVAAFWEGALGLCGDDWGDDQKALAAMLNPTLNHGLYQRRGKDVRFLPVDPWNLAPEHPGDNCSSGVILHFRGPRKEWMKDYCAIRLGIGQRIEVKTAVNASDAEIFENVRVNSLRPLEWAEITPAHDGHAVLVGGGPSLADTIDEIKWRAGQGQQIFALNGAANWLVEHGVVPDAQIVIDARPENVRFVKDKPARRYFLASQCDPSLYESLSGENVQVFHPVDLTFEPYLPKDRNVTLVGGGITSGLTAMALAHVLGYRKLHLYGYDSSDRNGEAHPYPQAETTAESKRVEVWCGARKFTAGVAMYRQAEQFQPFARMLANEGCIITVHGDGLLPALAREMARMDAAAITGD